MHKKIRHRVTIEHDGKDPLHSLYFGVIVAFFKLGFQVLLTRRVGGIVKMYQTVRLVQECRHAGKRLRLGAGVEGGQG